MSRRLRIGLLLLIAAFLATEAPSAAAPYKPHSVIVKLRSGLGLGGVADRLKVGKQIDAVPRIGARVFHVDGDPAAAAARLERSPLVAYAEPNYVVSAAAIPNDPLFGQQYALSNTGQGGGLPDADIDAPEGWDAAGLSSFPASGGVKVGIVDTGIDVAHPDLSGKVADCAQARNTDLLASLLTMAFGGIEEGTCPDNYGHGTLVAGVLAADANNGIGITGVAFNSPLAICKALGGPLHTGSSADVANCIIWAHDSGAKVISMSLLAPSSTTLKSAIDYAWQGGGVGGSVLVAAAGNDSNATLRYPAAFPNVVSVAATDNRDQRASFSNQNNDVEVSAPGVDVLTTSLSGYSQGSGTSLATPAASGAAAIIWDRYPGATAAQIVAKLDAATDDLGPPGRDPSFGFGRLNLFKAATG